MSEALLLQQRCMISISMGESHFREFKTALEGKPGHKKPRNVTHICRDIGEALVAFANADGGELFIGVEDDREITGIPHDEDDITRMLDAPKTHVHAATPLPITFTEKVKLDKKIILLFGVSKGTTEIYQLPDGRCVRRKDVSTVPVAVKYIQFERQEVRSREYDRQFVDGASAADLDLRLLQVVAGSYAGGLTPEWYLQQMGLGEYTSQGLRLRRAALLLFARDIGRWLPHCQVRILRVLGTRVEAAPRYNVVSEDVIRQNIFDLITQSWERLRSYIAEKIEFGADAKFEQRYLYPEHACREALINAIAHRDYSIQNGIDVFIFDDRMEIKSPGALLSTLTIDALKRLQGEHESRNALVARVLRENNLMRELGEGMKRMFEAMDLSDLPEPIPYSNGISFTMTFTHQSIFTREQQMFLEHFKNANLSRLQKRIVVLGMEGREISPREISKSMKTDDRDTYDREVTPLRNAGILAEVRTNRQAAQIARASKISNNAVARFKVVTDPAARIITRIHEVSAPTRKSVKNRTVYVGNLAPTTNVETIENLLQNALRGVGHVERIVLPRYPDSDRSKGYAFVELDSTHSAETAVARLHGTLLDDRSIVVNKSRVNMR